MAKHYIDEEYYEHDEIYNIWMQDLERWWKFYESIKTGNANTELLSHWAFLGTTRSGKSHMIQVMLEEMLRLQKDKYGNDMQLGKWVIAWCNEVGIFARIFWELLCSVCRAL